MHRVFFLFVILSVYIGAIHAQVYKSGNAKLYVDNAAEVRIHENTQTIDFIRFDKLKAAPKGNIETTLSKALKLPANYQLKAARTITDKYNVKHIKYQFYINNIPAEFMVYNAHTTGNTVTSANGNYVSKTDLPSSPTIPEYAAFNIAKNEVKAEKYLWETPNYINYSKPKGELVYLPIDNKVSLAYKFDIYASQPLSRQFIYVDATNGNILLKIDRIRNTDITGTAITKYSGQVSFTTDSYQGSYRLREKGRGKGIVTMNLNKSTNSSLAIDFMDADNYWDTKLNNDDVAYDVHYGTEKTFDYYKNSFGRISYDGDSAVLLSYIHYDKNFANAFWDGTCMSYGDGDGVKFGPLTSLDVVAHELTHAVTEYSANLIYKNESGALNESFSDIFGVAVDFYANPSRANFSIGEQFDLLNGKGFRNMANPNEFGDPDTYKGMYWDSISQEVHQNSGVQNYWFYLLCAGGSGTNDKGNSYNVNPIGIEKAAAIAYRTLTVYLTPLSTYTDACFYSIKAAEDLFGACSPEVKNVTEAWNAVGLGNSYSSMVTAGFTADNSYSCTAPFTVNFINQSKNANNYTWDFGDGSTSNVINPTHLYQNSGKYSVSLIASGSGSCNGTDSVIKKNYIEVSEIGSPKLPSCFPTISFPNTNSGIFGFKFAGIYNTSSGSIEGNKDFCCSHLTKVLQGKFYDVKVITGVSTIENVRIWIDANNDGIFDTNEQVFESLSKLQYHIGRFKIPQTAILNTPLRLRVVSDVSSEAVPNACGNLQYGQAEDYSIIVVTNDNSPIADFNVDNNMVGKNTPVIFNNLSSNIIDSTIWLFPGGTPSISRSFSPSIQYNSVGDYNVTLIVKGPNGTDTITKANYIHVVNQYTMSADLVSASEKGILYDSGGAKGNYGNNESSSFKIQVPCAKSITLTFDSLSLEYCCDRISIYEGQDESGKIIYTSSSDVPIPIIAKSNQVFIKFTADGSMNYEGFKLRWIASTPTKQTPVADFTISDSQPALNTPVKFTDISSNEPAIWNWNFNDGNTSAFQNPQHIFNTPGIKTISLIADNCFSKDTITKQIEVQDSAKISLDKTTFAASTSLCSDSLLLPLIIRNNGNGDMHVSLDVYPFTSYDSTSIQSFSTYNSPTSHNFVNVSRQTDSIQLIIKMVGDYEETSTYSSLTVDGTYIGIIPDLDLPNGDTITAIYNFGKKYLSNWITDGKLNVTISNTYLSKNVPGQIQKVELLCVKKGKISVNPTTAILHSGESITAQTSINTKGMKSDRYTSKLFVKSNDPQHPQVNIPVNLVINGEAGIHISKESIIYPETIIGDSVSQAYIVNNTGCDTLFFNNLLTKSNAFKVLKSKSYLLPWQTDTVKVQFKPVHEGLATDTLSILTNIGYNSIYLSGNSLLPPVTETIPSYINAETNSCGDSVTVSFKVRNSGASILKTKVFTGNSGVIFAENFEHGINPSVWQTITGVAIDSACGTGEGRKACYFNGSEYARKLISKPINTSISSRLVFDIYAGDEYPCNLPEPTEELYVAYKKGTGAWIPLQMYDVYSFTKFSKIIIDIPEDAKGNAVQFGWFQDASSGYKYDIWAIDDIILTGTLKDLNVTPDSLNIPANNEGIYQFTFKSNGLYAGKYNYNLVLTTNEPGRKEINIPTTYTVKGQPAILSSKDTMVLACKENTSLTKSFSIRNTGCDTLKITFITTQSSVFTVDKTKLNIVPSDSGIISVTFNPSDIINYKDTLKLFSNNSPYYITLTGIGYGEPSIESQTGSLTFNNTLCNNSTQQSISIKNTGQGPLTYSLSSGIQKDSVYILALTTGTDYNQEYTNTKLALLSKLSKLKIIEFNTYDSVSFKTNLKYADVLLIPEQENINAVLFQNLVPAMQAFANNGRTVILCGTSNSYVINTGFFSGNYYNLTWEDELAVDTTNFLCKTLPDYMMAEDASFYYNITNNDKVSPVKYYNYDVVSYRNIGKGRAYYIGFDFYSFDDYASTILTNAVKSAKINPLPIEWLSFTNNTGIIYPGDSNNILVTANSAGLAEGTYKSLITVSNNSLLNGSITVPVTIQVTNKPCADFGYTILDKCNGIVSFKNKSYGASNIQWSLGVNTFLSTDSLVFAFANEGWYNIKLIAQNYAGIDSISKPIYISLLKPDVSITGNKFTNDTIKFFEKSGTSLSYHWDFGDGSYSTTCNASHVYENPGIYNVIYTFENLIGCVVKDTVTLKVDNYTEIDKLSPASVKLYPNPNNGRFSININDNKQNYFTIDIIDNQGKLIERKTSVKAGVTDFDLCKLVGGTYFIKVNSPTGANELRVIVNR